MLICAFLSLSICGNKWHCGYHQDVLFFFLHVFIGFLLLHKNQHNFSDLNIHYLIVSVGHKSGYRLARPLLRVSRQVFSQGWALNLKLKVLQDHWLSAGCVSLQLGIHGRLFLQGQIEILLTPSASDH